MTLLTQTWTSQSSPAVVEVAFMIPRKREPGQMAQSELSKGKAAHWVTTRWALACAVPLTALCVTQAAAQSASGRGDGIAAGGFLLKPSIEFGARFDDNIAQEDGGQETDDIVLSVAPALKAESTWRRHKLVIDAGVTADRHIDNTADDTVDAQFGVKGRMDVTRATKVDALVSYDRGHDNRGDDNTGIQAEPTKFDRFKSEVTVRTRPNRLSLSAGAGLLYSNYHDADAINNDDDRDVLVYTGKGRVAYGVQRHLDLFVAGNVSHFDYVDAVDDSGFNRDSTGYSAKAGVAYHPSSQLRVSIGVGYLNRTFDDPNLGDVSGLDVDGSVNWALPNRLTNLNLTVSRSVAESQDADAAARLVSAVSFGATHNLGRRVTLEAKARYANLTDEGGAGNTDDNDYSVGLGASYKFSKRVRLGVGYDYKRRSSSDANGDYSQNVVGLRLKVGFLD